ncbi:MAG TPA: hypothetical protein VFI24_20175 [Pyrinomonadaceae bacterium]|nr:hypothetical protein [Pyrinomonadaceae bacterium]
MKVLLDSNVWRYVANQNAGAALEQCALKSDVQLVVVPALVFEARKLKDDPVRNAILKLLAHPAWTRLMPEAFLEAQEIKTAIRRFRPDWLIPSPDLTEVNALELDWRRDDGGFWSRAHDDIAPPVTKESLRGEREHDLARQESQEIRKRVLQRKQALGSISIREVYGIPPSALLGWQGKPVEYWRVPSLYHIKTELDVYASPYREWLDSEINVVAIAASPESLTKLWYYEITPNDAPRQWVRGAFELLQAFHKVTSGNPADSQLSSHLVDVDVLVSADRNFVRFAEKCRADAPFTLAQAHLVAGGVNAVSELLALVSRLR